MSTAWEASADELCMMGWGEHYRHQIPSDWRDRRGPDPIPGQPDPSRKANKDKANVTRKLSWHERRLAYEASKAKALVSNDDDCCEIS